MNNKYRVEFTVRDSIEEPIVTVCNIIELSNHYKMIVAMITLQGIDPKMIANNLTPSNPIHPGELIKDEIEYRRYFAAEIGIANGGFSDIAE